MIKIITGTMFGICFSISGFYFAYKYLEGLEKGSSLLMLLLSALFVGIGSYILVRTGKSNAAIVKDIDRDEATMGEKHLDNFESTLEKNNKLSEEWAKSVEHKDRLKLLQMSANIKEQAQK